MANFMNLQKNAHIHLMGICGTAMASLAGMLKDLGYKVTGSDQNVYPPMSTQLESQGIEIMQGYKRENLQSRPDLVIVGNVMSKKYEEVQALLETDIPYTSMAKALGEFIIADKNSVVVSGTHGKTTTTSMLAWILECSGKDPGYMIGGIPNNFERSYKITDSDYFVIEGDEYDTAFFDKVPKFIHYKPRFSILSSIEFDHADIYRDLDHVKEAFTMLLDKMDPNGVLVFNGDDKNIDSILNDSYTFKKVSVGFKNGDFKVSNVKYDSDAMKFDLVSNDNCYSISIDMFGDYNILNASNAFVLALQIGIDSDQIISALKTFKGAKRRQEIIGRPKGITVVEDFAHHPTAVGLTIAGVKQRFQEGKTIAVFEPRSATSRRKVFQQAYIDALSKADEVWVAVAFNQTSIADNDKFSSEELVNTLREKGINANYFDNKAQCIKGIKSSSKSGDVVVIMSNGGFDGIYKDLLSELEN